MQHPPHFCVERMGRICLSSREQMFVLMKSVLLILGAISILSCRAIAENHIFVEKNNLRLSVVSEKGDTLASFPVSVGTNSGNKQRRGDLRTPEGNFTVRRIENSSGWDARYVAGQGRVSPYGPVFIRLWTAPWSGIGIHGTSQPSTIGTRESEGCIRMLNEDVLTLSKMVTPGMSVIVTADTLSWPEKVITHTSPATSKYWKHKKRNHRKSGRRSGSRKRRR